MSRTAHAQFQDCEGSHEPRPLVIARYLIRLEAGYARHVQGGADIPKMALFGNVVLDLARTAGELARTTRL